MRNNPNVDQIIDSWAPGLSRFPANLSVSEPIIIRYDYSSAPLQTDANVVLNVTRRMIIESVQMTTVMRWKGGNTIGADLPPQLRLAYRDVRNVLLMQTFPGDSAAGAVPVTEAVSNYVSTTQKLDFNVIPFIAEKNIPFYFQTQLATYQLIFQADFTCNVTICGRAINQ